MRPTLRIPQTTTDEILGNFSILKALAHAYAGNIDVGVRLGIEGLAFARRYDSPRHVSRVQRMYDRLSGTPILAELRRDR